MNTLHEMIQILEPEFQKHLEAVEQVIIQNPQLSSSPKELLDAEPSYREEVDAFCRAYAISHGSGWPAALSQKPILIALVAARCKYGLEFATWLAEFFQTQEQKSPHEWLEWLLIDSWWEAGVHQWRESQWERLVTEPPPL